MERNLLKTFLAGAMLMALASPAIAQTPVANVMIDTAKPGAEIDRHIYGQFAEHLGTGIYGGIWVGEDSKIPNIHGYRADVVEALRLFCRSLQLARRYRPAREAPHPDQCSLWRRHRQQCFRYP